MTVDRHGRMILSVPSDTFDGGPAVDLLYLIKEELAIMKQLDHPNLVSIIEVIDDPEEDVIYMVSELCRKGVVMSVGVGEPSEPNGEELCRFWFQDLILGVEYRKF